MTKIVWQSASSASGEEKGSSVLSRRNSCRRMSSIFAMNISIHCRDQSVVTAKGFFHCSLDQAPLICSMRSCSLMWSPPEQLWGKHRLQMWVVPDLQYPALEKRRPSSQQVCSWAGTLTNWASKTAFFAHFIPCNYSFLLSLWNWGKGKPHDCSKAAWLKNLQKILSLNTKEQLQVTP